MTRRGSTAWDEVVSNAFATSLGTTRVSLARDIYFKATSAQGWCPGMTQRDGMEREAGGGSGWGTHVNPWLIHVNVWQKPLQYC